MFFLLRPAPLVAAAVLPLSLCASVRQQDRSINDLSDPVLQAEIGQLGYYPESLGRDTVVPLNAVALRSWSVGHVEFADAGVRVRIETQPFHDGRWVRHTRQGLRYDGHPIIGWSAGEEHRRMSRVELVLDGAVVDVPASAYTDLFDPHLCEAGPIGPTLFTAVARSTDSTRLYVLTQIGEGTEARMVTWVFEQGRYRFRVVDGFRFSG